LHLKHIEVRFMVSWAPPELLRGPPESGKAHISAATLQRGSDGTQEAMSPRIKSRQATCGTFIDGMEMEKCLSMQECLQNIQRLEAEAKAATRREHDFLQQLCEARSHIIEKERKVCDLHDQLSLELTESQGLWRSLMKRDMQILSLQEEIEGSKESHAGSKNGRQMLIRNTLCQRLRRRAAVAGAVRTQPSQRASGSSRTPACAALFPRWLVARQIRMCCQPHDFHFLV